MVVVVRRGKPQKRSREPKADGLSSDLGGIFPAEWLHMSIRRSNQKNDGVKTFGKYYSQNFLVLLMSSRSPNVLQ